MNVFTHLLLSLYPGSKMWVDSFSLSQVWIVCPPPLYFIFFPGCKRPGDWSDYEKAPPVMFFIDAFLLAWLGIWDALVSPLLWAVFVLYYVRQTARIHLENVPLVSERCSLCNEIHPKEMQISSLELHHIKVCIGSYAQGNHFHRSQIKPLPLEYNWTPGFMVMSLSALW